MNMKTALEQISCGILKDVINRINENQLELTTNNAIKLLISCCTVCSKRQQEIPVKDVCFLVNVCSSRIEKPDEIQLTNYLQSTYHILRYLLTKDFSVVLQLEDSLFPKFLPKNLSENQSQICGCFSSLIYNAVLNEVKEKLLIESTTITASILSLKFLTKTASAADFLERTRKFFHIFAISNVKFTIVNNFYLKTIKILKENFKSVEKPELVFVGLMSIIRFLIRAYDEFFTPEELQKLADVSLKICREFCNTVEYIVLLDIMTTICKFITGVPPLSDLQSVYSNLKSTIQMFGLTENVATVCQTMSAVFIKLCRNYNKNVDEEFWCNNFTVCLQLVLYKLLKKTAVFVEQIKIQCICCDDCKIKNDLNSCINLFYVVGYMFRLSISKNVKSEELFKETLSCLEASCSKIVTLKNAACLRWKSSWLEIGSVFYNICVALYNSNDIQALEFLHVFIQNLIKLEGTTTSMIKESALDTAIACYIEICSKTGDYAKAMKMSAFHIFLKPKSCDVAFVQWIKAKKSDLNCDQNVTIVDMLQIAEDEIKIYLPDFNLHENLFEELITAELTNYKARWPSKIPMLAAFNKLYKCVPPSTAAQIFIKIFANTTFSVAERLTNILDDLIEDYKKNLKESDLESNLILACLYFCIYKYTIENMIIKNSSELKKNVTVVKRVLPPYETPFNPNDECDIAPLCHFLSCESQMKTKAILDKSLRIFEKNYRNLNNKYVDFLKDFEICQILIHIGYEYQLHCYSDDCKRTWLIVLKIAEILNDNLLILKAKTALIEHDDSVTDYSNLIKKVLDDCQNSAEKWEVLTDFHLTLSQKYLEEQNASTAFEEFQLAQKCYQELLTFTKNDLLQAKLLYVHFKFIILPCSYKLVDHGTETVVKIHQAQKIITNYYKEAGRKSPNAIILLFEITLSIASWYRWLHLPREVRCYTREVAVLSQQLASPLRAAHFLVILAYADLLTCRDADSRAKLFGISTILCIPKEQSVSETIQIENKDNVMVLVNEMEELSLDLPVPRQAPASPTVSVRSTFKLPPFLGHSKTCNKFCCKYLEYQQLTVMQSHLEALISIYSNNSSREIQEYFEGALYLLKSFAKRANNCDAFWEIHANILLDYANILLKGGQKKYAEKINNELLVLVRNKKLSNIYLFNAAHVQKLDIIWNYKLQNESMAADDDEEISQTIGTPPKTPEKNVNEVKITCNESPSLPPLPYMRARKKLNLNPEAASTSTAKAKTPIKTPEMAVPSIKVYAAEIETTKKKKSVTAIKAKTRETKNSGLENNTPCDNAKIEKLRSKTKLLTDRIKKDVSETKVRKNLMSELTASESTVKTEKEVIPKKGVSTRKNSRNLKI